MTDVPSRVLVSGGNGFVGRAVTRQLVAAGRQVCVVDNLRSGDPRFGGVELGSVALLRLDLLDAPELLRSVSAFAPDAVIHLAAVHFIPECEADPAQAVRTNVVGSVNLLQACPAGIPFVLASSAAVYAPAPGPHVESDSPVVPEDVYGFTKLQAEQWLRYFASRRSLRAVVARLTNVLGPGETNPHVLPDIIGQLKAGSRHIEIGNLESRRDYLDVDDAARGLVLLAEAGAGAPGTTDTFNIASGSSHSVAELLDLLRSVPGVPEFGLHVAGDRLRPVDRPVLQLDVTKARGLGWEPTTTLAETLRRTWETPDFGSRLAERYAAIAAAVAPVRVLAYIVAPPHLAESGAVTAGTQLSVALAESHCEVDVALMADADGVAYVGKARVIRQRSTNPLSFSRGILPNRYRTLLYRAPVDRLIRRGGYDLVHIHNLMPTPQMGRVARAAQATGVPYVVSTHGIVEAIGGPNVYSLNALPQRMAWRLMVDRPLRRVFRGRPGSSPSRPPTSRFSEPLASRNRRCRSFPTPSPSPSSDRSPTTRSMRSSVGSVSRVATLRYRCASSSGTTPIRRASTSCSRPPGGSAVRWP